MDNNNPDEKKELPDIYFDRIKITITLFGVNMTVSLGEAHPPKTEVTSKPTKDLAVLRTGLGHAKVFAMLLRKQLKTFEEGMGEPIFVPEAVYEDLGLAANEW